MMNKYRYFVKIPKESFNEEIVKNITIYDLNYDSQFVYFYTFKLYDEFKETEGIEIKNLYQISIVYFLKKYGIAIFAFISLCLMFVLVNVTVTSIRFKDENDINDEVLEYVNAKLSKFLYIKYITKRDIYEINNEIRSIFYYYQWINIEKKGTILYIQISKTEDDFNKLKELNGGLYSKYDAFIVGYYCENGKVLVKKDSSVKKGDELISGILTLYNNENQITQAKGYVIGEVFEQKLVEIRKQESSIKRTGKLYVKNIYTFFGKTISSIKNDGDYDVEYKDIFNIGNLFSLKKAYVYEIKETIYEYNKADAIEYAKNIIASEFYSSIQSDNDLEIIISLNLLDFDENIDNYNVLYLLKSRRIVSEFVPY